MASQIGGARSSIGLQPNRGAPQDVAPGCWAGRRKAGLTRHEFRTYLGAMTNQQDHWVEPKPTAVLVLADGTVLEGFGLGGTGHAGGGRGVDPAMAGHED